MEPSFPFMSKLDRIDPALLQHNPRASLSSWLRYERIAVAAYRQHPKPYTFSSSSHAPSTIASRFRDAVRGAIAFGYPCDNGAISTQTLQDWWAEVIIKPLGDHVILGPVKEVVEELQVSREDRRNLSFHEATLDEIIAFSVLLSSGKLTGPVTIFQPPDISQLPSRDNVEVMPRLDGSLVLM